MYHYRWGSPVAANIVYPSGSPAHPVMFRKVEYQAANNSNLPHNVCNHFAASSGYPEYQAADACMTQPSFGLFSLEELTFDRWQGGIIIRIKQSVGRIILGSLGIPTLLAIHQ